jgi:hypothetical protein
MPFKRLVIVSGMVAFVLAAIGASMVISGANADPNSGGSNGSNQTANQSNSGPIFSRLGF